MKNILLSAFLLLFISFTSCIEINEEISINANGSGTLKYTLDLGAASQYLKNMNNNSVLQMLEQVKKVADSAAYFLKDNTGISNIKCKADEKKGFYLVGFDFRNSKDLNKALYRIAGLKKPFFAPSFFKITKHKIRKKDISLYIRKFYSEDSDNKFSSMFLGFIAYESILKIPSDYKSIRNAKSVAMDSRTIKTRFTLDEMLKDDCDTGNLVKF